MTVPREYDFALIKYSDMEAVPTFATLCGITNVSVNETVETTQKRKRDCDKPNKPGATYSKVNGTTWTVGGTGLTNADQRAIIKSDLFGKKVDYQIEYYGDDGTDAGELLGTDAGNAIMNTNNMSLDVEGDSSLEINLEGQGDLIYTAAP